MALAFYIIDTESTGLRVNYHELTEISIIRCTDKMQFTETIRAHNPENASLDALKITQKTLKDLENGKERDEVVNKSNSFFLQDNLTPAHRCIIGHNIITFDKKFLHALWESVGSKFPADLWLDTMALTGDFLKSNPSHPNIMKTATGKASKSLEAACKLFDVKRVNGIHNAKSDSRNNYLLWQKFLENKTDYLSYIKNHPHAIEDPDALTKELMGE